MPRSGNQHDTFKNLKETVYVGTEVEVEGVARDKV